MLNTDLVTEGEGKTIGRRKNMGCFREKGKEKAISVEEKKAV